MQPLHTACQGHVIYLSAHRQVNGQGFKTVSTHIDFIGLISNTGQRFAYLTALLVVKSNDHDMQHRSLHLVSALGLHSYPQAVVRAAEHCFSLGEGSPQ